MKVILYMAISTDGFIAKKDGDSDWVSEVDSVNFEQKVKEMGCIILGHRTFEQYKDELYPVEGVTNIVLTSDTSLHTKDNIVYVTSVDSAIEIAQEKGHDKVLLIGGGTINGSFLKEGLINEVFLSVHPLILGEGIKLFENVETDIKLELLDQKKLEEGLVQLHYQVIR